MIKKFNEMAVTEKSWEVIKHKKISEKDFNNFSEKELNRFVLCFNDGQGDHSVYNWKSILSLLCESDLKDPKTGEYEKGELIIKEMNNMQILDLFYNDLDLNGNNSDALYFDEEYYYISWVS